MSDYFSIEGYRALKQVVDLPDQLEALVNPEVAAEARKIALFPNIELRTSVMVKREDGSESKVNFHVIFSDELAPDAIEEHFLRELKFTARTNAGHSRSASAPLRPKARS